MASGPESGGTIVDALAAGVRAGDRGALARAISLVESTSPRHAAAARALLAAVSVGAGPADRIGITGVPGAGKSTFIEALGMHLCERGRRVAVLAIDPSSTITGGSILGDRTRMKRLGAHPGAFIRPSPAGGTLGGVARRTREVAALCQAAGYGVILIETVGVGQSETLVADLVDCVVALAVAGTGDELQGVKRGLLERVDVVAVNKADGENVARAKQAALELTAALRVLHGPEAGVPVLTCSGATGEGVGAVWEAVELRLDGLRASGRLDLRRQDQAVAWLETMLDERLRALLESSPAATRALAEARAGVRSGRMSPEGGAEAVIEALVDELGRKET